MTATLWQWEGVLREKGREEVEGKGGRREDERRGEGKERSKEGIKE